MRLGPIKPVYVGSRWAQDEQKSFSCIPKWITRASAWRGTNTPGQCHSLMYTNNLSITMIKGKINGLWNITDPHIFKEVNLCVTLIHYPKYNISPSNSLQDMEQNHWTIKYRSLTYIYLMLSIFVSHWSNTPTMMFTHQIILKSLDYEI